MADRRTLTLFRQRVAAVWGVREHDVPGLLVGAQTSSVRVNRLHPDPVEQTVAALRDGVDGLEGLGALDPVPWCADTYFCDEQHGWETAVRLASEGKVYLQNASSLIPVAALDPQPGERVLDVAAAPGGKAFHIAARMRGGGELWLNDGIPARADKLASLAPLYGVRYTRLTTLPAQYLDKELPPASFDRILLDVQCSGEGRVDLRRGDALRHWSLERVEKYKFLQTKMLDAAYRLLRPGGTMVYSTCTISPEENEFPVSQVLRRHDDLDLAPIDVDEDCLRPGLTSWRDLTLDPRVRAAVRVLPTPAFEAFFAAKLVKAAAEGSAGPDR